MQVLLFNLKEKMESQNKFNNYLYLGSPIDEPEKWFYVLYKTKFTYTTIGHAILYLLTKQAIGLARMNFI